MHLFTPCVSPSLGHAMSEGGRARMVVHPAHAAKLVAAVRGLQQHANRNACCPEWASQAVLMLLRWEILDMTRAHTVVCECHHPRVIHTDHQQPS